MAILTLTATRADALRAVADHQVYERGGFYYRYTPRDSVDITTIIWMFEGLSEPLVRCGDDRFFALTDAGEKALAEYEAQK
ncbi:hypothetical protein [Micromonospora carbonacea]|uniref:hypothetical protein n=1 Tax=Micromonospora carbonacea TaxID=47853 RepID=UPI003722BEDC